MLGTQLVKKLEHLGVIQPTTLCGSDLDWVFMGPESGPLSAFFTWFCDNIHSADVLSDDELQQYSKLEQSGQVLQGSALEAMAGCLVGVGEGEGRGLEELLPQQGPEEEERLQKELDKLDWQLKRLNIRKDQLAIQQLSTSSELSDSSSAEQAARCGAGQMQSAALAAAQDHAEALCRLAHSTDKLSHLLSTVDEVSGGFLVSTDLSPWQEQEQRYSDALQQLIRKQFPQGGSRDGIDKNVEDCHRQHCREKTQYHHEEYTDELRRLHHLVQEAVVRREREELRAAQHRAEAEEAGRALERLKRGHYGALAPSTLQQECSRAAAASSTLSAEVARQQSCVLALAAVAAQRPATVALTADCADKRRRQQRANTRQQQVVSLLVSQLSRLDCMSIMQQCEEAALQHTLHQLRHASAFLTLHYHRAQQRTDHLSSLQQRVEEDRALDPLPPPFAVLARLVQAPDAPSSEQQGTRDVISLDAVSAAMANVTIETAPRVSDVSRLVSGLTQVVEQRDTAHQQLAGLHQPHNHTLHTLRDKCNLLEDCLSGGHGSGHLPGTLPACWLPPHLLDQQAELEGQAHNFKTAMMDLLQQYEDKKRVVSAQPDVAARLSCWTVPINAASDGSVRQ